MNEQGQEPTVPSQEDGGQQQQSQTSQEQERFDAEYVKKLRSEAASYRKKLAELEAKAKAEEDAKLSETEQLKKKLSEMEAKQTELEKARQARVVSYEVKLAASRLGIVDLDAAEKLLDPGALEFDESGNPLNIEAALKTMISSRPWLVGSGGGSSPANPQMPRGNRLTMEDIKRMPQDEINRRWDEVSAILSGGK